MKHPVLKSASIPALFRTLGLSVIGAGLVMLPSGAIAQEYAGCFWIDDRGKRIDLSEFCPQPVSPDADAARNSPSSGMPGTPGATSGVISVPIERRDMGIPVVSVLFNGQPYDMLFDTGASTIVISNRMADELGLEIIGSMLASTASAAQVEFGIAQVAEVKLGGLVANNIEVAIGEADALELGLLGQNFYSGYDITIRQDSIEFTPHSGS